jgi:hypothetical protein
MMIQQNAADAEDKDGTNGLINRPRPSQSLHPPNTRKALAFMLRMTRACHAEHDLQRVYGVKGLRLNFWNGKRTPLRV